MAAAKRLPDGSLERLLTKGDLSWRTVIIVLIVSMHPFGQHFLATMGFPIPKTIDSIPINQLKADVESIQKDLTKLRADVVDVRITTSQLAQAVNRFDVNFERFGGKGQTPLSNP